MKNEQTNRKKKSIYFEGPGCGTCGKGLSGGVGKSRVVNKLGVAVAEIFGSHRNHVHHGFLNGTVSSQPSNPRNISQNRVPGNKIK